MPAPDPAGTRIGIFLFDGVEELDWVGPWEVLRTWQDEVPDDRVEVFSFARELATITCANGMRVLPDRTMSDAGRIDVLVYPGGEGTRAHIGDVDLEGWLRRLHAGGTLMTSVCTGALVYAAAGLLDGRRATTYHSELETLAALGEGIDVRSDARWIDDGDIITAAGVSAGIDAALHLVARLSSERTAREVRRSIEYDPQPPV